MGILIGASYFIDIDCFFAGEVDIFCFGVVGKVIAIFDAWEVSDGFTVGGVEDHEPGGFSEADKQAMTFFIQKQRIVAGGSVDIPFFNDLQFFAINDADLIDQRQIDVHAVSLGFDIESFWMCREVDVGDSIAGNLHR